MHLQLKNTWIIFLYTLYNLHLLNDYTIELAMNEGMILMKCFVKPFYNILLSCQTGTTPLGHGRLIEPVWYVKLGSVT